MKSCRKLWLEHGDCSTTGHMDGYRRFKKTLLGRKHSSILLRHMGSPFPQKMRLEMVIGMQIFLDVGLAERPTPCRFIGTNMLVLAINATTFSRSPNLLKRTSTKMSLLSEFRIEKSVLEINHVTNVTTVLSETTASDRVSRYNAAVYDNIATSIFKTKERKSQKWISVFN